MIFYNGTKILSLPDLDGNDPEIIMVVTNRTAGKSTFFGRYLVNGFKKGKFRKFMLLYRFKYELDNVADKFFKDISRLYFPEDELVSKKMADGTYQLLLLNGIECGYATAVNCADGIKKLSHLFSDVDCILMDEFQSEINRYADHEIEKFLSIHVSVARGNGQMVRKVPVIMLSNNVTMLNPYFTALGVCDRIHDNTKFLKGHGWVLEMNVYEDAQKELLESPFGKAFQNCNYLNKMTSVNPLNDSNNFIQRLNGSRRYIATLKYKDKFFSICEYPDSGLYYCSESYDRNFPFRISVTTDDHNVNQIYLGHSAFLVVTHRQFFNRGLYRFQNILCRQCLLALLSYY